MSTLLTTLFIASLALPSAGLANVNKTIVTPARATTWSAAEVAAADDAAADDDSLDADDANDAPADDEISYFDRFSPFSIDNDLDPLVDDNLFLFFASGLLFCVAGNVWLPALLVGDPPDGYWSDAWVSWLLHVVGLVVVGIALSGASVILQPLSAAVGPLMVVFILVNAFYLLPTATINAYNRGLKPDAPKATKKRKPKGAASDDDDDDVPAWMRESPPPPMDGIAPPAPSVPPTPPVSEDPSDAPDEILRY
jgi:hypothetical protein